MPKALLFAFIAALGNAVFVFGQRRAAVAQNPFVFLLGAVSVCTILFLGATIFFWSSTEGGYLAQNWGSMIISGVGFFVTFLGFYLLYSNFGAVYYGLYATLSILTTSFIVGVVIYREPINSYQLAAIGLAILAVVLFTIGPILKNRG